MTELTLVLGFLISVQFSFLEALLFPQFTILQTTMCMVIPINIPNRKVALNMGVQVNYNTPYTPAEFYNPPYWQSKSLNGPAHESLRPTNHTHVKRDLSAGEFYGMLGEILKVQGVDNEEECMLKAVCQMAKVPMTYGHDDLIGEILHFIFTPSLHQSFAKEEDALRIAYEEAETIGSLQGDCDLHFPTCHQTPVDKLTRLEEMDD